MSLEMASNIFPMTDVKLTGMHSNPRDLPSLQIPIHYFQEVINFLV